MSFQSILCKLGASILLVGMMAALVACGEKSPATDSSVSSDSVSETSTKTVSDNSTDSSYNFVPADTSTDDGTVKPLMDENFDDESSIALRGGDWYYTDQEIRQNGASKWSKDQVEIRDGCLVLKCAWNAEDNRVDCGAVWTKGRFEKVGGYYEARIKVPELRGGWHSFWMMIGDIGNVDGSSADGCEIDILESLDYGRDAYQSAIHWDGYGDGHKQIEQSYTSPNIYDGEFHIFGFERAGGKFVFYVDGEKVWSTTAAGLCSQPGYMILSSGIYDIKSAQVLSALPVEMLVDYVRVYRTKP